MIPGAPAGRSLRRVDEDMWDHGKPFGEPPVDVVGKILRLIRFAALLGYNPVRTLLGPVVSHLSAVHAGYLTGRGFFPSLITPAFAHGLSVAFDFAIVACLVAAVASLLRGKRYVHGEQADPAAAPQAAAAGAAVS